MARGRVERAGLSPREVAAANRRGRLDTVRAGRGLRSLVSAIRRGFKYNNKLNRASGDSNDVQSAKVVVTGVDLKIRDFLG